MYLWFYSILSVNMFVIGDDIVLLKVLDDVLSISGRITVIKGISLFLLISIYAYQLLRKQLMYKWFNDIHLHCLSLWSLMGNSLVQCARICFRVYCGCHNPVLASLWNFLDEHNMPKHIKLTLYVRMVNKIWKIHS